MSKCIIYIDAPDITYEKFYMKVNGSSVTQAIDGQRIDIVHKW